MKKNVQVVATLSHFLVLNTLRNCNTNTWIYIADFVVNHMYFNPMLNDIDKDHIAQHASLYSLVKKASIKKQS